MPITFKVANHDANECQKYESFNGEVNAIDALKEVWHPSDFKVQGE
jgi:hypothetical protein